MYFQPTLAKKQSISLVNQTPTRSNLGSYSSLMNKKSTFSSYKSNWRTPKHPRLNLKTNALFSSLSSQIPPLEKTKIYSNSLYVKELSEARNEEKRPISVCFNNSRPGFLEPETDLFTCNNRKTPLGLSVNRSYKAYKFPLNRTFKDKGFYLHPEPNIFTQGAKKIIKLGPKKSKSESLAKFSYCSKL